MICPDCGAVYPDGGKCWNCSVQAVPAGEELPVLNKGFDDLPEDVRRSLEERYR